MIIQKYVRIAHGYTVKRLSDICGVSASKITAIEAGQRKPDKEEADEISKALGWTGNNYLLFCDSYFEPQDREYIAMAHVDDPVCASEAMERYTHMFPKSRQKYHESKNRLYSLIDWTDDDAEDTLKEIKDTVDIILGHVAMMAGDMDGIARDLPNIDKTVKLIAESLAYPTVPDAPGFTMQE